MPRALTGLLAGLAFGASGAVFQTITRNRWPAGHDRDQTPGRRPAVVAGISFGFGTASATTTLGLLGGLF